MLIKSIDDLAYSNIIIYLIANIISVYQLSVKLLFLLLKLNLQTVTLVIVYRFEMYHFIVVQHWAFNCDNSENGKNFSTQLALLLTNKRF